VAEPVKRTRLGWGKAHSDWYPLKGVYVCKEPPWSCRSSRGPARRRLTIRRAGRSHVRRPAPPVSQLTNIEPAEWDEVFTVNVRGCYLMCRAFLPGMIERRDGDIVNLASVSDKGPLARRTPYCASKMAVIGMTNTLALEVGPYGIRVNSLSPGPVEGERMSRNVRLEAERTSTTVDEARAAFVNRSALGRMVTVDEVGQAVLAMLAMPGMSGAEVDLSAEMVA
jgi:NAD(P)-dependent dehydrogenase (short-subunit alcohol dehydrogenase family)